MRRLTLLALLLTCSIVSPALAEYPDRPIHLIVPQAAGSATDTLARLFAASLGEAIGQTIVVDDRPGGALTVGMDLTAKSPPDGYTLCMAPIGALALTPHMVDHLPYDIEHDFQPIVLVTRGQILLATSPTTSFKSVKDVIDYAKEHPGKLLNASSSNGSPGHVDGELFKFMTGTDIVHVPFKGGASAINDLIAGRVQLMFESLNSIAPFAKSGQVRGLAVSGDHARRHSRICRPSPRPACRAIRRNPGPASSRRPACRSRSSTSSTPLRTRRCNRMPSKPGSLRSATRSPAARRTNSAR
jgi:tripartite-type tricarboxylate transporter receptor subunit TctC